MYRPAHKVGRTPEEEEEAERKLEELEKAVKEEREARERAKTRLHELQTKNKSTSVATQQLEVELADREREWNVEEIAYQRLQMERLEEQQQILDSLLDKKKVHYDTIQEELLRRETNSADAVSVILNRVTELKKTLDSGKFEDERKQLVARYDELLREAGEEQERVFRLVDGVIARRKLDREIDTLNRQQSIQELNRERRRLTKRQEQLSTEKRRLELLKSKGVEVLSELELGTGPPVEMILRNLEGSAEDGGGAERDDDDDDFDSPLPQQLAETMESVIVKDQLRLEMLKRAYEKHNSVISAKKQKSEMEPYAGQLGAHTYTPEQMEYLPIVEEVRDSIVREVLDWLIPHVPDPTSVETESVLWERRGFVLEEQARIDLEGQAIEYISEEIMSEVVGAMVNDIGSELNQLNALAADIRDAAIFGGLRTSLSKDVLVKMRDEFAKRRNANEIKNTHSLRVSSRPQFTEAPPVEEEEKEDPDIVDIYVAQVPTRRLDRELSEGEARYWLDVNYAPAEVLQTGCKLGVAKLRGSPNGAFLAAATVKGEVFVWDVREEPSTLIRIWGQKLSSSERGVVTSLEWSSDASRLLVCDENGVVRVLSMTRVDNSAADIEAEKPLTPTLLMKVQSQNFQRSNVDATLEVKGLFGSSKTPATALTATQAIWHPSFTLTGTQPCLMAGLASGIVVKMNGDGRGQLVHHPIAARSQPEKPEVKVAPSQIEREFFQAHRFPIIFMAYLGDDMTMITVDGEGYIFVWPYTPDDFTGFGWFSPSKRYRLDTQEVAYTEVPNTEKILFPPPDVVVPDKPSLDPKFMKLVRKEKKAIDALALPAQPWMTTQTYDGLQEMIFAARNVPIEGAEFHTLYLDPEGIVIKRKASTYKKSLVPGELLEMRKLHNGNDLAMLIRYPDQPPKGPHVSLVVLEAFSISWRPILIEIPFSNPNFIPTMAVSPPIDLPGSDYLYAAVDNIIYVFSLATGEQVTESIFPYVDPVKSKASPISSLEIVGDHDILALCSLGTGDIQLTRIAYEKPREEPKVVIPHDKRYRLHAFKPNQIVQTSPFRLSRMYQHLPVRDYVTLMLDKLLTYVVYRSENPIRQVPTGQNVLSKW
eukprot:GFYU01019162.1.p1 GENE.GFYU01019162.1~~GFYU01019162.1.p1  ORF type:complete len:1104 (+),score=299.21 GFYU01019162.1:147-3458(+)